jgi:hypothetical protein
MLPDRLNEICSKLLIPQGGLFAAAQSSRSLIFVTTIFFCRAGGMLNSFGFGDGALFVRRLDRAQRGEHFADHINAPAGHHSYRSLVGMTGCSFQFGRTSTPLPPHWVHFIRGIKLGTVVSAQ